MFCISASFGLRILPVIILFTVTPLLTLFSLKENIQVAKISGSWLHAQMFIFFSLVSILHLNGFLEHNLYSNLIRTAEDVCLEDLTWSFLAVTVMEVFYNLFMYDTSYYFLHRFILHQPKFYQYFHSLHHKFRKPEALVGFHSDIFEITSVSICLYAPFYLYNTHWISITLTLFIWDLSVGLQHNTQYPLWPWSHHLQHHTKVVSNFGFSPFWDYILGTSDNFQ